MINYSDIINHYPDFPKPGIDFIDILPFLSNKEAFNQLIADIDAHTHCPNVVTVEARGFLFAAPLLTQSKLVEHIIPIRKKGKLPYAEGDLHDVEIMKEYGADHVYYRLSDIAAGKPEGDTFYLTFFDDILATGGTACGIAEALNREVIHLDGKEYKVRVKEFLFIVEFPDLYDHDLINSIAPVHSFIKIHGE
jgi:adenine phosphoribosyltransferase